MPKYIFELKSLVYHWDMDYENPYPTFNIYNSFRYLFENFESANSQIKELAEQKDHSKIYRIILRKLPLNERIYSGDFINLYVYDAKGNLLDHSLCANCESAGDQNEFNGRPENMVYFRKGEIVEWFNRDEARLGIIVGVPINPNKYQEIMEHYNKKYGKGAPEKWLLDESDDSYMIVGLPYAMGAHEHVFAPYVSKPTYDVPEELRRQLKDAYEKFENERYHHSRRFAEKQTFL